MPLGTFEVPGRTGAKLRYHPRLMLALLVYCYANGLFSSRRIERVTYRVTRNERRVHLGPTEFRLLEFFMRHPCPVSREELLDAV